jgi:hypothetical protein
LHLGLPLGDLALEIGVARSDSGQSLAALLLTGVELQQAAIELALALLLVLD